MRPIVLALVLCSVTPALAAPPLRDCPDAVHDAIAKAFPKARWDRCRPEGDHHEVKLTRDDGVKIEVDVAHDGTILQVEEPIAIADVPAAVAKAFAARYPKAKIERAEKQTRGKGAVFYELAFGKTEATFAANGRFVSAE